MEKPFFRFCTLVFGPGFTASQVGDALGVSRDTVRTWLKGDGMPMGRAVVEYMERLDEASTLVPRGSISDEEMERLMSGSAIRNRGPKS